MPKTSSVMMTIDEFVSYLKHTREKTVLVEGVDDASVYRYLEDKLQDLDADVLTCGGRSALLAIFQRRDEFPESPVVFLADKDMWYFSGVPHNYANELIFTDGYSIENDLYVDEVIESLMTRSEHDSFLSQIQCLSKWQAFHVEHFLAHGHCSLDYHVQDIAPGGTLREERLLSVRYQEPDSRLAEEIFNTFRSSLRGKYLFECVIVILSATNRRSKYSRENLLELGARLPNTKIDWLRDSIGAKLSLYNA